MNERHPETVPFRSEGDPRFVIEDLQHSSLSSYLFGANIFSTVLVVVVLGMLLLGAISSFDVYAGLFTALALMAAIPLHVLISLIPALVGIWADKQKTVGRYRYSYIMSICLLSEFLLACVSPWHGNSC